MIINAPSSAKRSEFLIENYLKLLNSGVEAQDILVLVQNSKKKKDFVEAIKTRANEGNIGALKVYSFYGLAYNTISENWAVIENSINNSPAASSTSTNTLRSGNNLDLNAQLSYSSSTSGIRSDASTQLSYPSGAAEAIEPCAKIIPNLCGLEVSQYIFKECIKEIPFIGYNSKTSLLHQLLRRNSLINLNNLSSNEVLERSKVLVESYSDEASRAIKNYKIKTINLRAFDYIRQLNLFQFLYKKLKNPFKYVFLDDGDEITPIELNYLETIKPTIKEFFIAYDSFGSSRLGYLGAINIDFEKFLGEKALTQKENKALFVLDSVRSNRPIEDETIKSKSFLKRNEMIEAVLDDIKNLINKGVKPFEIALITPNSDEFLKTSLLKSGFKFNFLTKNEKLSDNKVIGYILELLKIINDTNNLDVSSYVLKGIFVELLNLDKKESIKIIQEYKLERDFRGSNIFDFIKNRALDEFSALIEIYEKIRFKKLSEQLIEIVQNFVKFERENSSDIIKINKLLKQIQDFEDVFDCRVLPLELINQLENTIISENPLSDDEIDDSSIVVSTAQKIIDYSYKTKYQFLLDVSSENWLRQDIGPLYNAWVMQKSWNKKTFELADNIELTLDRTARILYKLFLLTDNTYLYSSSYDTLGQENFSGIDKYYKFKNDIKTAPSKPIIPRADQKEVLNYKGGLMSVSATAGSGKTTIMLLLVEKLLERGIDAKNIFVLTFMESAARNFKERIKARYPNLEELPSISTIHGLALRIIKENNNHTKIGLDYDFEIIDEIKRSAILSEICYLSGISPDKVDLYDKAISTYKNELSLYDYKTSNKLFLSVYEGYQKKLKEQNLIDYDDLLLLSLKLLKENPDVLNYYQDLVKIIIEDEAQDSSFTQQSLILLLGGKNKNIIRCGDINQAITSTFTNSDVRGFREFIKNSKNVVMDRCQRCATGVLDTANATVDYANKNKIDAFSTLIMKPVEGVNIVDNRAVSTLDFQEEKEESAFIVEKIKEIIKEDKNATLAVLLRSNFAINKWAALFENNSIRTYKNSDSLINNPVYKMCLLVLEYIKNPFEIKIVQEIANFAFELGIYKYEDVKLAQSLNKPFFFEDNYDSQLWWDLDYFLFKNHYSIYDLVSEIGSFYFSNSLQAVNIPLVAAIAKKTFDSQKTFENTVSRLREIQFKTNFSNIKFFNFEDNDKKAARVQIMTLHKSKGDEFDYVFIPELTKENINFDINSCGLKENTKFIQKIKKHPKSDYELKKDIVEENFRLFYVGVTRAKKKLYLSAAREYKYFQKLKKYDIAQILEGLKNEKN